MKESEYIEWAVHMLDEAMLGKTLSEWDGNDAYVNINNTPNKLRLGNCAFRALSKCTGFSHAQLIDIANKAGIGAYKKDDNGHELPDDDYGLYTLAMCNTPELKQLVDDVFVFGPQYIQYHWQDISLFQFTEFMSNRKPFKGKYLLVLTDFKNTDDDDDDDDDSKANEIFAGNARRMTDKLAKAFNIQHALSVARGGGISSNHAVAVKDGKYYDMFDSGASSVSYVVVFKGSGGAGKNKTEKYKFGSIGSDPNAEKVLTKAGIQSEYAKDIQHKHASTTNQKYEKSLKALYRSDTDDFPTVEQILKDCHIAKNRNSLRAVKVVDTEGNVLSLKPDGYGAYGDYPGADDFTYNVNDCTYNEFTSDNQVWNFLKASARAGIGITSEFWIYDTECYLEFDNELTYKLTRKFGHQVYVITCQWISQD